MVSFLVELQNCVTRERTRASGCFAVPHIIPQIPAGGWGFGIFQEQGRKLHLFEIKASASYSADFTRNMDRLSGAIRDVESRTVIYSGPDLPNGTSAGYFNFAEIARRMEELALR